ncbi:uncharacterized protein METZ01_LOCUS267770 [marine metagenome]|uniref:Uncharacterized protein n=1 Tax=marine metagenome TaxID=408172 RepID=A0A382JT48_9ZZZZ
MDIQASTLTGFSSIEEQPGVIAVLVETHNNRAPKTHTKTIKSQRITIMAEIF